MSIFVIIYFLFIIWTFFFDTIFSENLRDRPFNLKGGVMVFCFVQTIFFGQHKSSNIYFFLSRKARIFFHNVTLVYMTKTLKTLKNILSQLCMQHATYFTFSLWTALKCLFKFLRFAYSTPQCSHFTLMLLNSTLSINLDGTITFRPALVVVCSLLSACVEE